MTRTAEDLDVQAILTRGLTPYRRRMLEEAASDHGSLCPGGSKHSGQEASNWWRAMDWLRDRGMVERPSGSHLFRATPGGRRVLAGLESRRG